MKIHRDLQDVLIVVGVMLVLGILVVLFTPHPARSEELPPQGGIYFTLDSGLTAFKWGANQSGLGFPHFESPKWDIEPGIEGTPNFLARHGLWFRLSFPWQALGRSATFFHHGQTYVDGPRIGIRWRGRLVP